MDDLRYQEQDAESLSGGEDLSGTGMPGPSLQANPVHSTLSADGFSQEKQVGSHATASRIWKDGFFTMWVKANPAGGKQLRYAVCECNPGKCKE